MKKFIIFSIQLGYFVIWSMFLLHQWTSIIDFSTLSEDLHKKEDNTNRLLSMEKQLQWLRELGFVDVDCYWKWLELALLTGYKI